MKWAEDVARMGIRSCAYCMLVGRTDGKRSPGDLGVDGRIILNFILKESDGMSWARFFWLKTGAVGRELVITLMELVCYINCREFLD
jgi:hypothetical protein